MGERNVVSNYDFKYPENENWHKFTQPLELSYESINVENGKKMLLGKVKFDFELESKFKFHAHINNDYEFIQNIKRYLEY